MQSEAYAPPVRLAAAIPWFSLGLLLAYAGLAALQVGHWPMYGRPDPGDVVLGFAPQIRVGGFFLMLILISVAASLIAMGVVLCFLLATLIEQRGSLVHEQSSRALTIFSLGGLGLWSFLIALQLHANWLLD